MKLFLDNPDKLLTGVFIFFALLHIALIHRMPYSLDFLLKAIPVICLSVMMILYVSGPVGILLAAGFIMSALGDVALGLPGHKPEWADKLFIAGLACFLVAHILYIAAFAQDFGYSPSKLPWLILIPGMAIVMGVILYPKLGDMRIPVLAYIFVILLMGVFAALRINVGWALLPGAILFVLSDSTIAIDRFLQPFQASSYVIMVTYYLGQFFIARAFVGFSPG